jgi:hypothetical protein
MAFSPGAFFFFSRFLQHFRSRLQINHEVRRGNLFAKIIEVAIVGIEFLIVEIEAGEELVFFKNVIGDDSLIRMGTEIERTQLFEAPDQECQLCLEGGSRLALIERLQKRIVRRFDDALGRQALSENRCQGALAHAYGTFNRNVTGKFEKLGHGV